MRIALACPYAWDDPGGVQVHVRELSVRLIGASHDVMVLAPARGIPSEPWVRAIGRPVDVPYNASNAPIDPRPWSFLAVRDALRAFGPDVVHAHEPLTPSTAMWATLAARAPVVATFHSGVERSLVFDAAAPVLRRVARRIVVRVAVSRAAERSVVRRIGGSCEIVPNGVDVERFANAPALELGPGTKLLFVGRLDERKGFRVAVAAFERLAQDRPKMRLVAIGDGPERAAVDRLPSEIRDRVTMVGFVPNEEIAPYYSACDLYLGPAIGGESFGYVLVEAMAAGLPVVASAIPGYDEVVRDGVDGLLVPARDPGALARSVSAVLDDPVLAARLSAAGREHAAAFDWSVVTGRIEEVYGRAIARGPLR